MYSQDLKIGFRELDDLEIGCVAGGMAMARQAYSETSSGPVSWPPPGYTIGSTYIGGNDPMNSPDMFYPSSFNESSDSSTYTATLTNSSGNTFTYADSSLSGLSGQVSSAIGSNISLGSNGYTVSNGDGSVSNNSYFSPDVVVTAQSQQNYHSTYSSPLVNYDLPEVYQSSAQLAQAINIALHTTTSSANGTTYSDTPSGVNMTQMNGEAKYLAGLMESLSLHGTSSEWASVFYTLPNDPNVYYTDPVHGQGNDQASLTPAISQVPDGATIVGEIHSHPVQEGVDGRVPSNPSTGLDATRNDTTAAGTLSNYQNTSYGAAHGISGSPNLMTYIVSNDGGSSTGVYAYDMQNVGAGRVGQKQ